MNELPGRARVQRRRGARLAGLPALLLALAGCVEDHVVQLDPGAAAAEDTPESAPPRARIDSALHQALDEALDQHGFADVVVVLAEDAAPQRDDAALSHTTSGVMVQAAAPYAAAQARIIAAFETSALEVLQRYEQIPYLFVRVRSHDDLGRLATLADVAALYEDILYTASLSESLALIKQPTVEAQGLVGAGTAVAVLDTGCDFTRPAFGSCQSPGGDCKVAFARDFATEDNARDASGHGSNVAGIVLGVAPGTKLLALDVFNGESAASTSILSAIDWVVQNRAVYNISAMNLSLGAGLFNAACPNDLFAAAMGKARSAGVLPVAATGNNAATNSIASPACVPGVVSVGAVYDAAGPGMTFPTSKCSDASTSADKVACFSNSAAFMSMLAPGSRITAAGVTASGTSQASPHVAGAVAVIRARFPDNTLDEVSARLTTKGPLITDSRNGVAKRRLDLSAALADELPPDVVGPSASLSINEGASITRSAQVSLGLTASDASGVATMCFSNTDACTNFVPYATRANWSLSASDAAKKVNAWVKDKAGNVSKVSATILLDTKKPSDGVLVVSAANASVSLSWSGFSDESGVASYLLVQALEVAPANCLTGSLVYRGSEPRFTVSNLANGKLYAYRVCALDGAGNLGLGKSASARPAPEFDAPTGSLRINAGESYTMAKTLALAINAADQSRIAMMCISSAATCSTWVPYKSTSSFTVTQTSGLLKLNVWLRDEWQNASASPFSASIGIDTKPPVLGLFVATPASGGVRLSWAGATDTDSGVLNYRLVAAAGATPPTSCQAGTLLSETLGLTFTHLASGTYSYRLCAQDRVGNWTVGKTLKAILP